LVPANHTADDDSGIRGLARHFKGLRDLLALPPGATGLAVFSQDGRIIRKLVEDAALVEQEVIAQVEGQIAPDGLARLAYGLAWQGRPLPPSKVSWQNEDRLRFALKGVAPAQLG
jgi:23S rRNA pseudouridine2604 synthase